MASPRQPLRRTLAAVALLAFTTTARCGADAARELVTA